MSFSLIASPIFAQQAAVDAIEPELCVGLGATDEAEPQAEVVLPCLTVDGTLIVDEENLQAALDAQADMADETEQDTAVENEEAAVEVEADLAEDTDAAVVEEEAVTASDTDNEEIVPEDEPAVVSDEPLEIEEAPSADVIADDNAQADVAVDGSVADDENEASPEADVVVEEDAQATDDAPIVVTEGAPEGDDTDVVISEGLAEGEDTEVVVNEGLPEGAETEVVVSEGVPADATEDGGLSEDVSTIVDDTSPATAAAAAETEGEVDSSGEVVVEELSEDDVRGSDQDFETAATGDVETSASNDDDGLSNFERALLVGLGAVVVGSVLNNGDEVVSNSGDRVVVRRNDELVVLKDDDVLLRQPGSQVQTESFDDGSTRVIVTRQDGTQIKTIRGSDGRVLQRTRIFADGSEYVLFDDTQRADPIDMTQLPQVEEDRVQPQTSQGDVDSLRLALMATQNAAIDRTFSLRQIRQVREVRALAPEIELDTITFATASAAIQPSQAEELTNLAVAISNIIEDDPRQVFLIEGHTDAVGDASYNLALSDRRAETVALAMTEYFDIPPENLITQGYGESALKVSTPGPERANRRASIRNITSLLR
ncbi:Outer membrane protein, OmpA/MotB family [Roseobacter sp. CCS2]|nr:Outer membrane protein, OmpA/MotB family [Roseobacter sp. CCS2]